MDLGAILDAIKIWTESVISTMGYPGLVLVMFLENIFPPIPSEVVLPLAGNLTNAGRFTMFGVIFWGMIGALIGALVFYYLGKWFSEERLRRIIEKYGKWALLDVDDFDRAVEFFDKHGQFTHFLRTHGADCAQPDLDPCRSGRNESACVLLLHCSWHFPVECWYWQSPDAFWVRNGTGLWNGSGPIRM